MKEPSYYAVLTAEVRYDKSLTANAKLLYAEITALSQKEGYAWASNKYFGDLYGVDKDTVSRWVGELVKQKYIEIEVDRVAGNQRKIKILGIRKNAEGIRKNVDRYTQKRQDPIRKNADIILQENIKKNKGDNLIGENRGKPSPTKERIKEFLQTGRLKELKSIN